MAEFRMPSLGADMEHGTLLEWLVKPGDAVHRGDVIAVVDTDKAAIEVETFVDGTVSELVVRPGEVVPVGAVLAHIGAAAETTPVVPLPAPVTTAAPPVISPLVRHLADERGVDLRSLAAGPRHVIHRADVEQAAGGRTARPTRATTSDGGRVKASPLARRLAAQAGLALDALSGTGSGGAITAADVERARAVAPTGELSAAQQPAAVQPPAERPAAERSMPARDHAESMRRAIATLMDRSNREIPHYYLTSTVDLAAATAWLHERNRELPVDKRLVPAALLLKATAVAAGEVRQLNGFWVDGAFRPAATVDLGMVVSLRQGGIVVPVIPDAPSRSVGEIMSAIRDLVRRARLGRLRGSELSPPSITVSNLGDFGTESVLGVIYPPQVALVGFGAVVDRPWAVDGMLAVRPVVTASLAADHRASDGAIGARLLNRLADLLQKPAEL